MNNKELQTIKKLFTGKKLIVLEGQRNCGKTTTLFEVARQLAKDLQPNCRQCCIDAAFNVFINPDGTRSDIRVILPIGNGWYIYLSTFGDTLVVIENNITVFENDVKHSIHIYLAHETGLKRIDWKDLSMYPPMVCVTACSYPQSGKNKAMAEQMKEKLESFDKNGIWLKKKSGSKQPNGFSNEDTKMIDEILKNINGIIAATTVTKCNV